MSERVTAGADGVWSLPLPAGLMGGQPLYVRARQARGGAPSDWSTSVIVTPSLADVAEIDAAWAWAAAEGLSGAAARARVAGLLATSYGILALIVGRGLVGSTAGADFRLRRYWLPAAADATAPAEASEAAFFAQFTAAATATRTYFDASGVMRADLAANQPRFSWAGGARRLVLEAALTNKLFARKHNPVDTSQMSKGGDAAAVLSVVDDSAALLAGGLGAVCTNGAVYKLDNTAGTTDAIMGFNGPTGNLNAHCVQAWMRGSGTVSLRLADNTSTVAVPLTSGWTQYQSAGAVPTATNMTMRAIVPAGGVLYLILPGLYEALAAPHAPIIGDTIAQVTRAAEAFRLPAGLVSAMQGACSFVVRAAIAAGAPAASALLSAGAGAETDRYQLFLNAAGRANLLGATGGVATVNAVSAGGAILGGEAFGAAAAVAETSYAVDDSKGALATSSAAGALPAVTHVYLGRRQDGGAYGAGLYDLMGVWPARLSDARIQDVAVPYAA